MAASDLVVRVDAHDDVMHIVMARPPANALGVPLVDAVGAAIDALEAGSAKVLVVSSAVPGFFAAGADIKFMSTLDAGQFERYRDALRSPLERLAACGRPSIAAIDGRALGGGLELAMACTLRFATRASRLGLPEVKLGLIPGAGGTQRLPRLVGPSRALELMLSGREIDGPEAAAIGLVDVLVESDVTERALRFAAELARLPGPAMRAIITCVAAAQTAPERGMAIEGDAIARLFADGHADAGIAAFMSKRRSAAAAG
jgi:enoyl-CoA hydratase/carnithine racemase